MKLIMTYLQTLIVLFVEIFDSAVMEIFHRAANNIFNAILKYFLIFSENRSWHLMQIVSIGNRFHEISKTIVLEKIRKQNHQFVFRLLNFPIEW